MRSVQKSIKTGKGGHAALRYLLVVALMPACWGCKPKAEAPAAPAAYCIPEALREKIRTDTVVMAPVTEARSLTGEVAYNPDKVLHYISLVSGVITQTWFSLGDYVRQGQVLAELKSTELSGLVSEQKTLESRLSVARRSLDAAQAMYRDGIASEKDLLEAKSQEQIVRAELEKVSTSLSFFSPGKQPETFLIRAPGSGFIVDKNITSGIQITAGNGPLFTVSDLANVWITANVYAGDLAYVKENMPVVLRSSAYKDETFTGTIRALSQVFDAEEKVLKARIVMDNPGLQLKPGMFMDVIVKKETGEQALRVPEKALIFNDNKDYVVVYKSDCDTEIREVEILAKSNDDVYISKGLQAGERVISRNHLLIFEALQSMNK